MGRTHRSLHCRLSQIFGPVCGRVTEILLGFTRQTPAVYESFGLFIGAAKPLEQESNHLKMTGNVSAAHVKAEERQAQAAGGAGVGGKMLLMKMMEVHFCQAEDVRVLKARNSR